MKYKIKKSKAFTIVELLIVIVIIGILAAVVFVTYTNISKKAIESGLKSDLNSSRKLLSVFYIENGENYPDSIRCDIPNSSTNKCIKPSFSDSSYYYTSDNSQKPATFSLIIVKGDVGYEITNSSEIKPIATSVAPVSSPVPSSTTSGNNTTFSWTDADCSFGTSARYQYRFTINNGYDSGLLSTSNTSVSFSTASEGYTYSVQVQAQCYNSIASGAWSSFASINYFRPYTNIAAQSYSTPGTYTYTVPAGVNQITALIASGGGGGGCGGYNSSWVISSGGGGGGGSGSTIANISVTPGQQLPIVVGTGGAGGTSTGSNTGLTSGINGTSSSVGSVVVAGGGGGSYGNGATSGAGGAGGAVTNGTYNLVNNGYVGGWIEAAGGVGASSLFGKGGGNGVAAGIGAGGWGGQNNGSGSRGGDGMVVILASTSQTHGSQSYSTSGTYTYTVPAGVNQITALIASGGGGGGGGGYNSGWAVSSSGGGGGGSNSTIAKINVIAGQQLAVVVGKGGAGGLPGNTNVGQTSGVNGTGSSVGSVVVAGGGGGTYGDGTTAGIGGSGGVITGGTYNLAYQGYIGGWIEAAGGVGASSIFGKGGGNGVSAGIGAGGWGGQNNSGGNSGGNGMVVIFW